MNKKVCDWCNKEVGISKDGYTLDPSKHFVHIMQRSLVYYNPHQNISPEPTEKFQDRVEICDDCHNTYVKPLFGWSRELIVYPHVYVIGKALHKIHDKLNEEWNKPGRVPTKKYHEYLTDVLKKIDIEFNPDK